MKRIHKNQEIFWCRNARDLPTPQQLQAAIDARLQGVLLFARYLSDEEKVRCTEILQSVLPGARISDFNIRHGFDRVDFQRVLERAEIISHADELMRAAREFTQIANDLCKQLAAKIGISTTELSLCGRFLPSEKEIEEFGILNAEWKYFFHGVECKFEHRETGQTLDVVFGYRDEFGVVQAWFWRFFIESTPHFNELSSWLTLGVDDLKTAIEVLTEMGSLIEIDGSPDFVFGGGRRGCIVAPS